MSWMFDDLPRTPETHFRLTCYAAIALVIRRVGEVFGSPAEAYERFPFLEGYRDQFRSLGADHLLVFELEWWDDTLRNWLTAVPRHLPLRALQQVTRLTQRDLILLHLTGLVDEDAHFGVLFDQLQGGVGQRYPTAGLIGAWCGEVTDDVRALLRRLLELGLLQVRNLDAPRSDWALHVPEPIWDALRGETPERVTPWARHQAREDLPRLVDLIVPDAFRDQLARLSELQRAGEARAVVVRGPRRNGRTVVLRALARELGRGTLEIPSAAGLDDLAWRQLGLLATLLRAVPVVQFDLEPGATVTVPALSGSDGIVGVVIGTSGGVNGAGLEGAVTLPLDMPDPVTRRRLWAHHLPESGADDLTRVAERVRLTGGNIARTATLAAAQARLDGSDPLAPPTVRRALHLVGRAALEPLTTWVPASGSWGALAVSHDTTTELALLEARCRYRERLPAVTGPALQGTLNAGVRALFSGPSGTGKTLAARLLAAELGLGLYRLDIASTVSKYIGETEKNLQQVFTLAEELGVVLLLDEGDALLTQRTAVQTSNDRYANLETSYLLQRIEAFEGILVVTTNAADRIDSAFQRRMDVIVEFRAPGLEERWAIWQLHLPVEHAIALATLDEVATRCELTGGQIRNAALHAALLALDDGGVIGDSHLLAAVRREYRKSGAIFPLRASERGRFREVV